MLIIEKDLVVLSEGSTQGLDGKAITAKAKYYINFLRSGRKFCWSLHYNGNNSFYLLTQQKYVNSKKKFLKFNHIDCVWEMF